MRVALFGGSFDPPHGGHLALARLARERLALDRLLVTPVAAQPLKHELPPASFADRVAMAGLAFADEPRMEISMLEAPRPDGKLNYTLDTLNAMNKRLAEEDRLFCILGADSFLSIGKWHKPDELLMACDFIVGARPGFDLSGARAALPPGISAEPQATKLPHVQVLELTRAGQRPTRLYLLLDLDEDVSATDIRAALQGGTTKDSVLAPTVLQYIRAHHLYTHL